MLNLAKQQGKLQVVPFIQFQKEPKARKGFVEVAKFDELLGKLPAHLRPYVMFLYHCGGRRGEAEQLDWAQVDLRRGLILLEDTKNDEDRIVPLPVKLAAMLAKVARKEGRVFDTTNIRKEWMTACAACGLGTIIEVEEKPYDPRLQRADFARPAPQRSAQSGYDCRHPGTHRNEDYWPQNPRSV
jgi:integrase